MSRFLEVGIPIWYKASAALEAIFYLKHRKKSLKIIEEAKKTINNTRDMEEWYLKNEYKYISDKVDLSSYPWVVVARKGGDCDDFMSLSLEILSSKCECIPTLVYAKDGRGHAILIVKQNGTSQYTALSNQERFTEKYGGIKYFNSIEDAANYTYGDQTRNFIYLKYKK